jgi:hypothetical protein
MDEFAPLTLEEAVYQAIGAASMCWEDVAKAGVFDSTRAKEIGDDLLVKVRTLIAADIEAGCVHGRDTLLQPSGAACYRCAHAARVARGDA